MTDDTPFIRSLCDLEIPGNIHFSPDGEQVLYTTSLSLGSYRGRYPVSTIWLATATEAFSSRPLTSGTTKDFASSWHPAEKQIAFVSDRAEPGKKWAIYSFNVSSPQDVKALTPVENERTIESFKFSPDGRYIAFLSADEKTAEQKAREQNGEDVRIWGQDWPCARLRLVDTQTTQIRSFALERHVVRFDWSPTGAEIAIVSCKTTDFEDPFINGSTISVVNQDLTEIRDVCHFPDAIRDLNWAKDGKLYFWAGVPLSKKFGGYGVYAIECNATGSVPERVAFGLEDDAAALIKVDGEVIARVQHRLEDRIVQVSGRELYSKKQEILSFDVSPSIDHQASKLAVATSDVNSPVEVYVTTDNGNSMLQLSSHGRAFESRTFGICHYLTCPSTDGEVELDSLYLEPASHATVPSSGTPRAPLPTVVLIHGGPVIRLTNSFDPYHFMWTPYLLSLGIGVLIPNYRGSSGGGKKFGSYSIGGVGVHDYADIIAMTQSAIDQGFADREQMVVGGWSQGGLLTNLCSVRNGLHEKGWKFNAAITGASICDIDSMALMSDMGSTYHAELHRGCVIWNMDRKDTWCRNASALWAFKEVMERSKNEGNPIIPPMLILHGEEDKRIPVSQAWGLRRALESYSLPFELAVYPRQGHFFHEQNFWVDMALRVAKWSKKYTSLK